MNDIPLERFDAEQMRQELDRAEHQLLVDAEDELVRDHDGTTSHVPVAVLKGVQKVLLVELRDAYAGGDFDYNTARKLALYHQLENVTGDWWNDIYQSI